MPKTVHKGQQLTQKNGATDTCIKSRILKMVVKVCPPLGGVGLKRSPQHQMSSREMILDWIDITQHQTNVHHFGNFEVAELKLELFQFATGFLRTCFFYCIFHISNSTSQTT